VKFAVDVGQFPWLRRLAVDYAKAFAALAPFFAGDPDSPAAWREAVARTAAHQRPREALAALLHAQQQRRGAPAEAQTAAARLAEPQTVAVVTGQQAGLFGGPLYTLLKAVTALQLAERATQTTGVPTVPVFWIDAEDHDWDEVAACGVLDGQLALRTITLPRPPGAGETPVALVRLDERIRDTLATLEQALAPTEFTAPLLAELADAYCPGRSMVDAFGRWLEHLLGTRGLVVFDAADPAAKPLVASVFARELERPGRTRELAERAGAELVRRGYHAQVTLPPDSVALFHLVDGLRRPIRRRGTDFAVGDLVVPAAALLDEARRAPEHFSPNVLLRPIVQDTLFPTVCYVAGPNELAYQAQLREVYAHFGVPMPLVYPRASATILDAAAVRFLTRYRVPLEQLQPQDEAALNRLLETQLPPTVFDKLANAQQALRERMADVIAAAPTVDPTLEQVARSTLARLEHDLETLHDKIIHAAKRRNETLRRQFRHAQAQAFPHGHPQERVVGFVYFLNRYGPALIDRLLETLPLERGRHWVLTI
jgi:bacillithiol biosynthesis cysteine-adding enzyme BshC